MIAALCEQFGPPEALVLRELPDPRPGPGEVLVAPTRVALNFFDTLIIEDKYQLKPGLPFSPGGEFCGRVVALGPGVEGFAIGQRVGVPWLGRTCGVCPYCSADRENLCDTPLFSGVPQ
jgi:NADPH:quinone reductase